jgi:MFS superfamily sulfate permease-like transporter
MIALIGYLDSVVAAKQNSDRFGYSVSSNREWVALGMLYSYFLHLPILIKLVGISNMGGSLIPGTLPAYGSITR